MTILSQFDFVTTPVRSGYSCGGDPKFQIQVIYVLWAMLLMLQLQFCLCRATYPNKFNGSVSMNLLNSYSNVNIYKNTQYSPYPRIYDPNKDMMWFAVLTSF